MWRKVIYPWKEGNFCKACREVLRTLVIKVFLRMLLACQVNSVSWVNGNGTISAMHIKKCLKLHEIKICLKTMLGR